MQGQQYKMYQFEPSRTKTLTLPIFLNQNGKIYPFVTPLGPFQEVQKGETRHFLKSASNLSHTNVFLAFQHHKFEKKTNLPSFQKTAFYAIFQDFYPKFSKSNICQEGAARISISTDSDSHLALFYSHTNHFHGMSLKTFFCFRRGVSSLLNHRVSIERKSPYRESYTVNSH